MQTIHPPEPLPQLIVTGQPKSSIKDICHLALVMFLWALCFPLIVVGLALAPPLTFAALRAFVAGVGLLLPAVLLRRAWPRGWRVWLGLLGVGLTTSSMGFGGMFLAGGLVSPGLATV
jgi:drug/metabolite transporter (DMT)-like permease